MDGTDPTSMRPGAEAGAGTHSQHPAWRSLQAATAALHARVEASPLMAALMSADVDTHICTEVLQRLFDVHAGWERANAACLQRLDWPWRPRAPVLRQDLLALGVPVVEAEPAAPRAQSDAQAWGMLYVVEGSALGGRLIARHLRQRLPAVGAVIRHFDADPGPGWPAFRTALEQALPDPASRAAAAAGARAMFEHFHGHLARATAVTGDAGTACA